MGKEEKWKCLCPLLRECLLSFIHMSPFHFKVLYIRKWKAVSRTPVYLHLNSTINISHTRASFLPTQSYIQYFDVNSSFAFWHLKHVHSMLLFLLFSAPPPHLHFPSTSVNPCIPLFSTFVMFVCQDYRCNLGYSWGNLVGSPMSGWLKTVTSLPESMPQ